MFFWFFPIRVEAALLLYNLTYPYISYRIAAWENEGLLTGYKIKCSLF